MITKLKALQSLLPDVQVIMVDDEISQWLDEREQPTAEAIATEKSRLEAEYNNNQYQRDRADAYPEIGDQLDYIFHNGLDAWKADIIQPIKDQFPKP